MEAEALANTQQHYTRVSRRKLLKRLHQTRDHHVKAYEIAIGGWRQKFAVACQKNATKLTEMAGKAEDTKVENPEVEQPELKFPPKPESHESDYKTAIARFSMSLDQHIWLSHKDFNQLVMDNWSWRQVFAISGRIYAPPSVYTRTLFDSPELSADFLKDDEDDEE